jgi:hypothetical protein
VPAFDDRFDLLADRSVRLGQCGREDVDWDKAADGDHALSPDEWPISVFQKRGGNDAKSVDSRHTYLSSLASQSRLQIVCGRPVCPKSEWNI